MNFSYFSLCLVSFVLVGGIYYITPHYHSLSEKLVAALIVTLCGAETIADNINKAMQYMGRFICSIRVQQSRIFPLEFFIVLSLKTIKKFQRTNATAIRECCKRIHPIFPLLRIFPTYLSYPVNKTSQHFELRSQCTYCIFLVLICFLSICQMYFKRELCVTPATLYTCFKQI